MPATKSISKPVPANNPDRSGASPQQARSRRTKERILAAAEELLAENLFEEIGITQIVAAAPCTVGSFYHLFGEKEGLLPDLYQRHCQDLESQLSRLFRTNGKSSTVDDRARKLARTLVRFHRRKKGLLRALVLRSHTQPQDLAQERSPNMQSVVERIADWLVGNARRKSELRAAGEIVLMMLATVRECILYPETTAYVLRMSDGRLEQSLSVMATGYLRTLHPARRRDSQEKLNAS